MGTQRDASMPPQAQCSDHQYSPGFHPHFQSATVALSCPCRHTCGYTWLPWQKHWFHIDVTVILGKEVRIVRDNIMVLKTWVCDWLRRFVKVRPLFGLAYCGYPSSPSEFLHRNPWGSAWSSDEPGWHPSPCKEQNMIWSTTGTMQHVEAGSFLGSFLVYVFHYILALYVFHCFPYVYFICFLNVLYVFL